MRVFAVLKYDYTTSRWVAVLEDDGDVMGTAQTQEEAVENLRYQADKHDLWPKKG